MNFKIGDHVFFPLPPYVYVDGIKFKDIGNEVYAECTIFPVSNEDILLIPEKNDFPAQRISKFAFDDYINKEIAIIKTNENQYVDNFRFIEPIENSCGYIVHEGTCIKEK